MRASGICIAVVLFAAGCAEDSVVEVGVIESGGAYSEIRVPASARVGEPVLVELVTFGDGCTSHEDTVAEMTDDGAEITPYDRRRISGDDAGCPQILLRYNHDVSLAFDSAGVKVIRINGRRSDASDVIQQSFSLTVE